METNPRNDGHERDASTQVPKNLNTTEFVPLWKVKGILKQSGCPAQRETDVFRMQNTKFEYRFSFKGYDPFKSQQENRPVLTTAMMETQRLMHRTKSTLN